MRRIIQFAFNFQTYHCISISIHTFIVKKKAKDRDLQIGIKRHFHLLILHNSSLNIQHQWFSPLDESHWGLLSCIHFYSIQCMLYHKMLKVRDLLTEYNAILNIIPINEFYHVRICLKNSSEGTANSYSHRLSRHHTKQKHQW